LLNNNIITIGGTGRGSFGPVTNHAEITALNLANNTFSKVSLEGNHFVPRKGHSTCALSNNKLLIFGGIDENGVMKEIGVLTVASSISSRT